MQALDQEGLFRGIDVMVNAQDKKGIIYSTVSDSVSASTVSHSKNWIDHYAQTLKIQNQISLKERQHYHARNKRDDEEHEARVKMWAAARRKEGAREVARQMLAATQPLEASANEWKASPYRHCESPTPQP